MRDSFVFYRSFYEAVSHLADSDRLAMYDAICAYGLNGNDTADGGVVAAMMALIRPQIDANQKRYENGKKGGRPEKTETEEEPNHNLTETKAKPNDNPTKTKQKPNHNQSETKPEPNVNVNVNVNANVNENALKDSCPEPSPKASEPEADVELIPLNDGSSWRPTQSEYEEMKRLYPAVNVEQEFRNMRGWCSANPSRRKTKSGVKRFVTSWLSKEQNRGGGARAAPVPINPRGFNNYEQRDADYAELERQLLQGGI